MEPRAPLVYFVFGTPGSGRRRIIADLIENGLDAGDRAVLIPSPGGGSVESPVPVSTWEMDGNAIRAAIPAGTTHAFMLADPRLNPVVQVEALVAWLPGSGAKIGRVLTVVDCALGVAHAEVMPWFEACVHFSDVVFLTNTAGASATWAGDFEKRFKREHYPCLFERPVNGEVSNPALVLETRALRMSPAFEDEFVLVDPAEIAIDDDDEPDDLDPDDTPLEDRYFARNRGGGNRIIPVPDISPFLSRSTGD